MSSWSSCYFDSGGIYATLRPACDEGGKKINDPTSRSFSFFFFFILCSVSSYSFFFIATGNSRIYVILLHDLLRTKKFSGKVLWKKILLRELIDWINIIYLCKNVYIYNLLIYIIIILLEYLYHELRILYKGYICCHTRKFFNLEKFNFNENFYYNIMDYT